MKILIICLVVSINLMAQINLAIGLNTSHVEYGYGKGDYKFNEQNKLISLEYQKDKDIIGLSSFVNSFGNNSITLYYGHESKINKRLNFVYRVGIVKGYNAIDTIRSKSESNVVYCFNNINVFYKDFGILATAGLEYKINKDVSLEADIMSNAVISSIKYKF